MTLYALLKRQLAVLGPRKMENEAGSRTGVMVAFNREWREYGNAERPIITTVSDTTMTAKAIAL